MKQNIKKLLVYILFFIIAFFARGIAYGMHGFGSNLVVILSFILQAYLLYLIIKIIFFEHSTQSSLEGTTQDQQLEQPSFNYKRKSMIILFAAIVGIVLSFVYFKMVNLERLSNINIVSAQTFYYGGVAVLLSIASIFLYYRRKIGIYLFSFVILFIVASFFIPSNLYLPEPYNDLKFVSLFTNSIVNAWLGGIFLDVFPIVGVIIYFSIIIKNLSIVDKWAEFLEIKGPDGKAKKIFYYLKWLFVVCILLGIIYHFFMLHQPTQSQKYWSDESNYGQTVNIPFDSMEN